MKIKLKVSLLLILSILQSCDVSSSQKIQIPVKVFVAWPGQVYLPHYDWKEGESKPLGVEPELIELILTHADIKFEYVKDYNPVGTFDSRIDVLTSGNADISIRGITINEERSKLVSFSSSYYIDGLSAIVKKESSFYNPKDLEGLRIFASDFSTAHNWCLQNIKNVTLISFDEDFFYERPEILLEKGLIDAYVVDRSALVAIANEHPNLRVFEEKFTQEPLGIAVAKNNPELLKKINQSIDELTKNGELQRIVKKFDE